MYQLRKNKISIKKIAKFLKINYTGKDFDVTSISSLNNVKSNSILFYSDLINFKFKLKDNVQYDLKKLEKKLMSRFFLLKIHDSIFIGL